MGWLPAMRSLAQQLAEDPLSSRDVRIGRQIIHMIHNVCAYVYIMLCLIYLFCSMVVKQFALRVFSGRLACVGRSFALC